MAWVVFHIHRGGCGVIHSWSCTGLGNETGCYHIEQGKNACKHGCYHQTNVRPGRGLFKVAVTPPKKIHKLITQCNSIRTVLLNTIVKNKELKKQRNKASTSKKTKYQKQIKLLESRIGQLNIKINENRAKINFAITDEYRPKNKKKPKPRR